MTLDKLSIKESRDVSRAYPGPTVPEFKTLQDRSAGKRFSRTVQERLVWSSRLPGFLQKPGRNMLVHADRAVALQPLPQIILDDYQAGTFDYVSGSIDG